MAGLNWMLKCQEKLRKECAIILFPNLLHKLKFVPFLLLLILCSCAERAAEKAAPPRTNLENPLKFLNVPSDPSFEEAYADYMNGDFGKARKEFQKKLEKSPDHFPSYLGIGYTYLAEHNPNSAEKYIRKALDLYPDYTQAHFALASLMELQQNYESALQELNEVARINPDYPSIQESISVMKLKTTETHLNRARELKESNPEEALRHLKAALELAPEVSQIQIDIADIYVKQNNCKEAVPYLEMVGERAPENLAVKNQLADCLVDLDDYNRALTIYEELSNHQPENAEIQRKIEKVKKLVFIQNLPQEYHSIPTAAEISRAQFAALLIVNLEFLQKYSVQNSQILVDTINHWAKKFILKTVNLGIMDPHTNRTFEPDQPISRLELAKAASRVLEILELNEGKKINSTQEQPTIADVASSSIYYSMISKAIGAGLLSLDGDGNFHSGRSISGSEAISVVNRLKQLSE